MEDKSAEEFLTNQGYTKSVKVPDGKIVYPSFSFENVVRLLDEYATLRAENKWIEPVQSKKIKILSSTREFNEFVNRPDIEIITLDVRGCEQNYMFQESFIAVCYYKTTSSKPE